MTGRSERDFVRFGNRHRLQQFLHFPQPADFLNEAKEFMEAGEAANDLDRLGHRLEPLRRHPLRTSQHKSVDVGRTGAAFSDVFDGFV